MNNINLLAQFLAATQLANQEHLAKHCVFERVTAGDGFSRSGPDFLLCAVASPSSQGGFKYLGTAFDESGDPYKRIVFSVSTDTGGLIVDQTNGQGCFNFETRVGSKWFSFGFQPPSKILKLPGAKSMTLEKRKAFSEACLSTSAGAGDEISDRDFVFEFLQRGTDDRQQQISAVMQRAQRASGISNYAWVVNIFGEAGTHLLLSDKERTVKFERLNSGASDNDRIDFLAEMEQMKVLFDNEASGSWTLVDPDKSRSWKIIFSDF